MKIPAYLLLLCLPALLPAQVEDEATRLMQVYMARRAEWQAFRQDAQARVKQGKDDKEKKTLKEKMDTDEVPYLKAMTDAAKAYRAAQKAKLPPAPHS